MNFPSDLVAATLNLGSSSSRRSVATLAVCVFIGGCGSHAVPEAEDKPNPPASVSSKETASSNPANPVNAPKPAPPNAANPVAVKDSRAKGTSAPPSSSTEQAKAQMHPAERAGTGGWAKSDLSPTALGARIGKSIAMTVAAEAKATLYIDAPIGTGSTETDTQIKNPKTYHVELTDLQFKHPTTIIVSADGARRAVFTAVSQESKWSPTVPVEQPVKAFTGAELVKRWPTEFPKLALSFFLTRNDPWAPFVASLAKGVGGYKLIAERRTLQYNGKPVKLQRLLATRASDGAEIEIVVDGTHFLPVTIRSTTGNGPKPTKLMWTATWRGNQKFDPSSFAVPAK